jgi:TPR repeat protein
MENKNFSPMPMLTDPVLLYALKKESIDPEWVEICRLDKTTWDAATACHSYEIFRKAAEADSAFAMCMCYGFCVAGWGQPISKESAFQWVEKAAAKEYAPGYFLLGNCYENGIGIPVDIEQARCYYVLASDAGFGFAACHLAELCHSGKFGRPDMIKALEYATHAYQLQEPMAPLLIASWYEQGDGVIENEKEALLWYKRAAELGNFFASDRLNRAYRYGELGLPKDIDLANKFEAMFNSQLHQP